MKRLSRRDFQKLLGGGAMLGGVLGRPLAGRLAAAPALAVAAGGSGSALAATDLLEVPIFTDEVRAGTMPPRLARLPDEPRVIPLAKMGRESGEYGGTLRMLMGDQRDIRMVTIYGYSRLVGFDPESNLIPDILLKVDVEDGRDFTLHLRPGHRWSDGHPFTSEDFRYWWEDVALDKRLSRSGPPVAMLANDQKPEFEIIDTHTVRYRWKSANPLFLPALAGSQALVIAMPAHYMRQFHIKYAVKATLEAEIKANKVRDWGALHERRSRSYRPENPDLPSLDPWVNRTAPPAERFVFERNPYFHRVDEQGRQLPYIDRIEMSISASGLIPAKTGSGEVDLQARYLRFDNYTFLKESAKRQNYRVLLWEQGMGSQISLKPNLNVADPVWRDLFRDVRVRRALSVGINRKDINQVIFFGLGQEAANSVLPSSPLFSEENMHAWAQYDPALANRLLDEAGLTARDFNGTRLLSDGRPAFITVDISGESTEEADVMQLIAEDWAKLGLRLFIRSSQRDVFRRRALAGLNQISVWQGMDNATPSPDHEPEALAPANTTQFEWPLWGQYAESSGKEGEKPNLQAAMELMDLHKAWRGSRSSAERMTIWKRMLALYADQVFTIGLVNRTKQPVVVSNRLRNVPENAVFSFEPRAFFGAYLPDTFFFRDQKGA